MRCPKCKQLNLHGANECVSCGVVFAHIRGGRGTQAQEIERTCPWNDHGHICGLVGSLSDATNGGGPWYCATHYWKLKGWPVKKSDKPAPAYRETWYAERGLSYESAGLADTAHFQSIGQAAEQLPGRMIAGELGPRQRQPGEDSPEDIGEELQG